MKGLVKLLPIMMGCVISIGSSYKCGQYNYSQGNRTLGEVISDDNNKSYFLWGSIGIGLIILGSYNDVRRTSNNEDLI